jgi:2-polyprenyl-3-methyl-5-hydroxy-6-metoxy-1,4-benzoquinol methylase
MSSHLEVLLAYIRDRHPRSLKGVEEARAAFADRFEHFASMFVEWLVKARGESGIPAAVDAFVQFSTDVNLAQARYEADGRYLNKSFASVYADHYSRAESMDDYLWGIYLSNFLWAHHVDISLFYHDRFLSRLRQDSELIEIAPGHGGWGIWALKELGQATLRGFDISPSSIKIARSICDAAGFAGRATYDERNALDLNQVPASSADAVVCNFLVEHLEEPGRLFAVIEYLLRPRGLAFVTGALTAAQIDHIHEFRRESELVVLCEEHGLRVLETLSAAPRRTLPKARFVPRVMGLLVQKRVNEIA